LECNAPPHLFEFRLYFGIFNVLLQCTLFKKEYVSIDWKMTIY